MSLPNIPYLKLKPNKQTLSTLEKIVCCASYLNRSQPEKTSQNIMASFTSAILALVEERDRQFLLRVAQDYNLPFEELQAKYLETAEKAVKAPRKYTKKVKSVETGEGPAPVAEKVTKAPPKEKQCCTALTSKKEPCKFSALKGEVFCKRHLKQTMDESEPKEKKETKKETKKKETKKAEQPVHTHALDKTDEACDLCASHGNAFEPVEQEFEVAPAPHTGPIKTRSAAARLAAILAEADESDSESTVGEAVIEEEEYEEED
jgi:predicted secreted protein